MIPVRVFHFEVKISLNYSRTLKGFPHYSIYKEEKMGKEDLYSDVCEALYFS